MTHVVFQSNALRFSACFLQNGRLDGWGSPYEGQVADPRLTSCPHFDSFRASTKHTWFLSGTLDPLWPRGDANLNSLARAHKDTRSKPPSQWCWRFQRGGTAEASVALGDLPCRCDAMAHNFVAFFKQITPASALKSTLHTLLVPCNWKCFPVWCSYCSLPTSRVCD